MYNFNAAYLATVSVSWLYSTDVRMINECSAFTGMRIGSGNRSTPRKSSPLSLCPPHDLSWDEYFVATVESLLRDLRLLVYYWQSRLWRRVDWYIVIDRSGERTSSFLLTTLSLKQVLGTDVSLHCLFWPSYASRCSLRVIIPPISLFLSPPFLFLSPFSFLLWLTKLCIQGHEGVNTTPRRRIW